MKEKYYILFFILISFSFFSQSKKDIEDEKGNIITNELEKRKFENLRVIELYDQIKEFYKVETTQNNIQQCSNGEFEDFITNNGVPYAKDFNFYLTNVSNSQCNAIIPSNSISTYYIPKYNFNANIYAVMVPSNYIDPYLGNIKAFDQYALKLNYNGSQNSITTSKRIKTSNKIQFNYKVVMQTIMDDSHIGKQPYFKARILNQQGVVVDEFCLVADTENCIYKRRKENDQVYTLYTPEWRIGNLNISSIPNNEEFTVEFIAARCGLNGHFSYAYIDKIICE